MRQREREAEAETQAEGDAGSLQEPDAGLDPGPRGHALSQGQVLNRGALPASPETGNRRRLM